MTTINYAYCLYSYVYELIGLAAQDNLRYSYGNWVNEEISTDAFISEIQRVAAFIA